MDLKFCIQFASSVQSQELPKNSEYNSNNSAQPC